MIEMYTMFPTRIREGKEAANLQRIWTLIPPMPTLKEKFGLSEILSIVETTKCSIVLFLGSALTLCSAPRMNGSEC